jgi:hypothetical protein
MEAGAYLRRTAPKRRWIAAQLALVLCLLGAAVARGEEAAVPGAATPSDSSPSDSSPRDATLVRITSSFDVSHASAVLRQVAKLFHSGFVRKDADIVAKEILTLPAEQSRLWTFGVVYKGGSYPLQIRARLDDFGMLDLDFFSAPAVASAVRGAVDGYLNSRGL